ncbi:MAG: hypothetical protein PHC89_01385 [Candidatus Pacebacteria bacterium]|nr:hypothetical protein [Candidatus Paceibacterota bacterium]
MEYDRSEIEKIISELPNHIRQAVDAIDWGEITKEMQEKFKLHLDDIAAFREQSMLVIVGKLSSDRYADALIYEIGLSKEFAHELVDFADKRIFQKLQNNAFGRNQEPEEKIPAYTSQSTNDPYSIIDINDQNEGKNMPSFSPSFNANLKKDLADQLSSWQVQSGKEDILSSNSGTAGSFKLAPREKPADPNAYREPIEESDLRGIPSMDSLERSSLGQALQQPEQIFSSPLEAQEKREDVPNLEEDLLSQAFIPKNDILNLDDENDILSEENEGSHLKNLKNI